MFRMYVFLLNGRRSSSGSHIQALNFQLFRTWHTKWKTNKQVSMCLNIHIQYWLDTHIVYALANTVHASKQRTHYIRTYVISLHMIYIQDL